MPYDRRQLPSLRSVSCAVFDEPGVPNSGTLDQVTCASVEPIVSKWIVPPDGGSRSCHRTAMLAGSAMKRAGSPLQQRESKLPVLSQTKPLLEMSMAFVLPPGNGKLNGSVNGPWTWSSKNVSDGDVGVKKPVAGIAM